MPFGVTWGRYLSMWGVSLVGFACGSQVVHVQYEPLKDMDDLIAEEVERLRAEKKLTKPTKEQKLIKLLELDNVYREQFNLKGNAQTTEEKLE